MGRVRPSSHRHAAVPWRGARGAPPPGRHCRPSVAAVATSSWPAAAADTGVELVVQPWQGGWVALDPRGRHPGDSGGAGLDGAPRRWVHHAGDRDSWEATRRRPPPNAGLEPNPAKFPRGMKYVANRLKSMTLTLRPRAPTRTSTSFCTVSHGFALYPPPPPLRAPCGVLFLVAMRVGC